MSIDLERSVRLATSSIAALVLATACASTNDGPPAGLDGELEQLGWFVGVWQAGDAKAGEERPVQIEHWQVLDDGSLGAANYQRVGDEIVPHQNLAVRHLGDGRVVLEVTAYELVGDSAVPVAKPTYTLTEAGTDFARFEAPGVVPRAILYQRGPQGQMVISIVMPGPDGEKELFVAFERIGRG